ncbi:MAG: TIGR01212 family radical SAM protein [Rikenellaceae bacterium]
MRYPQSINDSQTEPPALFAPRRFNSYSAHFKKIFGNRMQKVTINAGFSCPNRDGKVGVGGCTFCINEAFTPSYCTPSKSITKQIDEGIEFHTRRYRKATSYLAYFQSFSNTYAPLERLQQLYNEAIAHPKISGIIVGTRPDCIDSEKLDYFASLAAKHYVAIEYGIESTYDATLHAINRGHDFECARWAVEQTAKRGIQVGAHFILGLPGESVEMLHSQIDTINTLPLTTIKFHQLQIFKGTQMADQYDCDPLQFNFWEREEYIDLFIDLLERLRGDIVVERFASEAPPRYHHGPNWGLIRNETMLSLFEKRLAERGTFQGRLCSLL